MPQFDVIFFFLQKQRSVIPTESLPSVQLISHLKLRTACLLSARVHGRASPVITPEQVQVPGPGYEASARKKKAEFLAGLQPNRPWTPGCFLPLLLLWLLRQRPRFPGWLCERGKLWLLKDWVGQKPLTEDSDQVTTSGGNHIFH